MLFALFTVLIFGHLLMVQNQWWVHCQSLTPNQGNGLAMLIAMYASLLPCVHRKSSNHCIHHCHVFMGNDISNNASCTEELYWQCCKKDWFLLIFDPWAFVFLMFCDMKWEVCILKCNKDTGGLFEFQAKLATFFLIECHLYLKEHPTDYAYWDLKIWWKSKKWPVNWRNIFGNLYCQW